MTGEDDSNNKTVRIYANYGQIEAFNEGSEPFQNYVARWNLYLTANQIPSSRHASIFLATCGPKVFAKAVNAISPKDIQTATYAEIVEALTDHFRPKVIVIFERYKFNSRKQLHNESIADFVSALKALSRTCEYNSTILDEMLRDQFVIGIQNRTTQQLLLTESTLDFNRAIDIASAREAAIRDSEITRHADVNPDGVNQIRNFTKRNANVGHRSSKWATHNSQKVGTPALKPKVPCNGCGGPHFRKSCPHLNSICYNCNRKGHISASCRSKRSKASAKQKSSNANAIESEFCEDSEIGNVFNFGNKIDPIRYELITTNGIMSAELDTGTFHSIISQDTYLERWPTSIERPKLHKFDHILKAYGGHTIDVLGFILVPIKLATENEPVEAKFVVVKQKGPTLLGRDVMKLLNIGFCQEKVNNVSSMSKFEKEYPALFSPGLGCYKDKTFSIEVDENVPLKFYKARPVPYALRDKVDQELDRLIAEGIVEPVSSSPVACPIVPVLKGDSSIRICGNFKLTCNLASKTDVYPIPNIKDMLNGISDMKMFSKLDLRGAYLQLKLDAKSKVLTTINTQSRGLLQYNRLAFGIASAPGIFQRAMEELFRDMPNIRVYLDDIFLFSSNSSEHEKLLHEVFKRLQDAGLKLRRDKCHLCVSEVEYLGFKITKEGLLPTSSKVEAIRKAPRPTNVTEVKAYLGLINFFRRFLPQAATVLEPLNRLLKKDSKWNWEAAQEKAFRDSKETLINSEALVHFDPKKPITVLVDSSSYGVGSLLCHVIDGIERPVYFASRTLNAAERKYSQTEKEALAIIYAFKYFNEYLWGQKFKVITDHLPLLGIFSSKKPISPQASGRIQRWSLMMQAYNFQLFHRSGKLMYAADALSRLPLSNSSENSGIPADWTMLVNFLEGTPVTCEKIKLATSRDHILSTVYRYTETGWPNSAVSNPDLNSYARRRDELSLQDGCLLWGTRVIVPPTLRQEVMSELHADHSGSSRMKELARSYIWWPNLDRDLENVSASCEICLQHRPMPPKAELHPWEWPTSPWHRIHADFAGPVDGNYFLIIIDAHSKWVNIYKTSGTATADAIKGLRHSCSTFGLPISCITDTGPAFKSVECKHFMQKCGILHRTTAVYKPSTNGLAENIIKSFKSSLKKSKDPVHVTIDRFLFQYRQTPHSTTGVSPSELMFGRKMRNRLDLLRPEACPIPAVNISKLPQRVLERQEAQKRNHCNRPRKVKYPPNTQVMIRNFGKYGAKWLPANVERQTGPVSYECKLTDGKRVKRHQDQIQSRERSLSPAPPLESIPNFLPREELPVSSERGEETSEGRALPRRSSRLRRPVEFYGNPVSH